MSVCPKCGNHIPGWAHGVCYTCERNEQDYQRYGRRRPAWIKRPIKQSSSKPTGTRKCTICGKKVRKDHLKSHIWHAHQLSPYATKDERQRARTSWEQKEKVKLKKKDVKSKTKKCPICGYEVPLDLVVAHKLNHQRAKKKAEESDVSVSAKPHSDHTIRQTYQVAKPLPTEVRRDQDHKASSRQMVNGINRLLEDIFGCPIRLSQILRKAGMSQLNIDLIRQDHLDPFLSGLVNRWVIWWVLILPPVCVAILIRRYDLARGPDLESFVANTLDELSSSEKDQLRAAALASLRKQKHRARLEQITVKEARTILGRMKI